MGKRVDITDKLSFDGNPALVIQGKELEVNADAPTMLKVMALMDAEDPGAQEIMEDEGLLSLMVGQNVLEIVILFPLL